MSKIIEKIYVDQVGWVYPEPGKEIEIFSVNGEMTSVDWYRAGDREFNGKYVIQVDYKPQEGIGKKQ